MILHFSVGLLFVEGFIKKPIIENIWLNLKGKWQSHLKIMLHALAGIKIYVHTENEYLKKSI